MNNLKFCLLVFCALLLFSLSGCSRHKIPERPPAIISTDNYTDDSVPAVHDTGTSPVSEPEISVPVSEDTKAETSAEVPVETDPVVIPVDGKIHVDKITLDRYSTTITVGQCDMPWVTMSPSNAYNKNEIWSSSNSSVAEVDGYGRITGISEGSCTVTVTSADPDTSGVKASFSVTVVPYPDVSDFTKINGITIVNKSYAAPMNCNDGIDPTAQSALNELIAAAKEEGLDLFVISSFRTFEYQYNLYSNYLLRSGRDAADRYSARPGFSEHHTGLAFDLNSADQSFGKTAEGIWLADNCSRFGFIIRYPKDKEDITGYMYEPWHIRYLGSDIASEITEKGICLEEYLGIDSVYKYQ